MRTSIVTIIILFLTFYIGRGQSIALLKTDFKSPILYTDSLTVNQIKAGYFPMRISEIDTFHASIEQLYQLVSKRQRIKMQSFEYRSGSCIIEVARAPMDYGDRYFINLTNKIGENTAFFNLSDGKTKNKKMKAKLKQITTYIENEKKFTVRPYTISPKYYNLVIITE